MSAGTDRTRHTLLIRLRNPSDERAWNEFVSLYRPLLLRYAREHGLNPDDAEDITQTCLRIVFEKIGQFRYDRSKGTFKSWLKTIVRNRIRDLCDKRREVLAGAGVFERPQNREPSPEDAWDRIWREEHLKFCLRRVREEVETHTFQAFWLTEIEQSPAADVARQLNMSRAQVYVAKSRVLRRLRELTKQYRDSD